VLRRALRGRSIRLELIPARPGAKKEDTRYSVAEREELDSIQLYLTKTTSIKKGTSQGRVEKQSNPARAARGR
jgi:hypothetical protein